MIQMPINSWSTYKTLVLTTKRLYPQYDELSDRYEIYSLEAGMFVWACTILKDDGDDHNDFEDNYKSLFNKKIIPDDEKLTPYGVSTSFEADRNTVTDHEFAIPSLVKCNKGMKIFFSNQDAGDTYTIKIIDKDNVLGLGANFVVDTPVYEWNAVDDRIENPRFREIPIAGLYFKISYNSTETNVLNPKTKIYINFLSFRLLT